MQSDDTHMIDRTRRCLTALAAAAMLTFSAPATALDAPDAEGRFAPIYDLYFGGVWVGEASLDSTVANGGYSAGAKLRTTGVVRAFFDASFTASAEGKVSDDTLSPVRFEAVAADDKKTQQVRIDYRNGEPAAVAAEPAFKERKHSIEATEQGRVPDPLTGALSALAPRKDGVCNRRIEMFDGQYRFAAVFGKEKSSSANEVSCEARYERIAGYKAKMMKEDRRTVPFTIWFSKRADGLWEGSRVQVPTQFAMIAMTRRD